ncbi:MAG: phosphoribosylaminoimidazolecarboxamide formyltransferase [Planctomycetes bacterium]|jgi:AICAR transformylase/IMP cyclohydrolase PurH|nr:phosphoribosylaminoimidazolecarboxamide formyltransferase [Planctomycetota bacterium]
MDIPLKYGCNPNQKHAKVITPHAPGSDGPLVVRNGAPSYINLLDALRGWQLVRDLKAATGKPAAASYKHVSPAGAAVAAPLSDDFCRAHFYERNSELSPVATAYARARSSDRVASFGDFIAVSEPVDLTLAQLIKPEVSDGIIAPGYDEDALQLISGKKGGKYVALQMDPAYTPPAVETRTEFGITLEQSHNDIAISADTFANLVTKQKAIPAAALETLIVATITLKHTQSNSVDVGFEGQAVGIGAGQQSRIACTRIACDKADRWLLKQHPKALELAYAEGLPRSEKVNAAEGFVRWHELNDSERAAVREKVTNLPEPITAEERADWLRKLPGVVLSSDAFIPFRDNLDRAAASGVGYVAQAGGSARDQDAIDAADEHGMVMALTGVRLFLH